VLRAWGEAYAKRQVTQAAVEKAGLRYRAELQKHNDARRDEWVRAGAINLRACDVESHCRDHVLALAARLTTDTTAKKGE
jgi:hypothetical protein